MAAAESEGHHHNNLWKDKKFKGTRVEVDNIYLTQDDLDKIMAVPEDNLDYYQLPHRADQVINRNIKKVAEMAGLNELVEIETTKGGTPKKEKVEKYKLIHTHTARRTGATLMYLAGIDIYDIMKVTCHASPKMLKKYIKADSLEVAEILSDKYDYLR